MSSDYKQLTVKEYEEKNGTYHWIDNRWTKVSNYTEPLKSFIPWKECNAGYYDEELGCNINSKDHYRQEMKKQGLVPKESFKYTKLKPKVTQDIEKSKKVFNESYEKAVSRFGSFQN